MAGGGAQSGKRKSTKREIGHKALQTAEEINYCRRRIIEFKTAFQIRQELSERYGLDERTADRRIKCAREAIKDDVGQIDRQEMAAMLTDMLHTVAAEATARGQFNNTIGAMRLIGEIAGITGNNRA
jgi:hypothetical protein